MTAVHEKQIRDIVARQQHAWNAGDAKAWSAPFTEQAHFINIRGTVFTGRAEIETRHAAILSSFFRGSRVVATVESITWAAADVAILSATHDVTHFPALPPGIRATEKQRLVTRMTCVVRITRASTCEIIFAQNTAVANEEEQ